MTPPGVYRRDTRGALVAVHEYEDDGYELVEVATLLDLGTCHDDGAELHLTRHELRLLEVSANAQSFDHAPEFIRMCLDIAALELPPDIEHVILVSIG